MANAAVHWIKDDAFFFRLNSYFLELPSEVMSDHSFSRGEASSYLNPVEMMFKNLLEKR